jgi:hypothetical protein
MILMQNDIWKETVAPIACSGCVLNDLATTRNRFVDVVPVWLGLLAAPEVQPLMSEAAVDCAAWDESLRAAAEACRIVDALCSCVAVFDVSNSQSVSWVHVDANGLFWGFCADGALREYKHRWAFSNRKCCFYGRCVALAALSQIMSFDAGVCRRVADSSFPAVFVDASNSTALGTGGSSSHRSMVSLLNEFMYSSHRSLAELAMRSLLRLQTSEEAKPIVFSHAPDLIPAAVRCLAQSVHVCHQLQARAAAAYIQHAMMLSLSKSATEEANIVLQACEVMNSSSGDGFATAAASSLPLVIGFWSVGVVVASVADLCVLPMARDAASRMNNVCCMALNDHRASVAAAKEAAAELKKKMRARANAVAKPATNYTYDTDNQNDASENLNSCSAHVADEEEGDESEEDLSRGVVMDVLNRCCDGLHRAPVTSSRSVHLYSCINVRKSHALSECGFGRLRFVQSPAAAANDLDHVVELSLDMTHFAPLDGAWKEDGDGEAFDADDGSLVHGIVGLLFCSNSASCVVDCLRAIACLTHDSHLRQAIVSQPGLLQLLCAMAKIGGCAQSNEDYALVIEVRDKRITYV